MSITMLDETTIKRARRTLVARGLLAEGDQRRARRLPSGQRPKVLDLMIPFVWYQAQKDGLEALRDINASRKVQGLEPLTAELRPELAPAPERKTRADKGKPRPKKAEGPTIRGGACSPPSDEGQSDAAEQKGGLQAPPRGGYKTGQEGAESPPTAPLHLASDLADDACGDGRRPTTGSRGEGGSGFAAPANERDQVDSKPLPYRDISAVLAAIPQPLVLLLEQDFPTGLPGAVNKRVAEALEAPRTVNEVKARVGRRWARYEDDALSLTGQGINEPIAVLYALIAPSWCEGGNVRCEDGMDLDREEECQICVEKRAEFHAQRSPGKPAGQIDADEETPQPAAYVPEQVPAVALEERADDWRAAREQARANRSSAKL
ncbi:hypothetical protein [Streptomyces platensis]|uniref:hypothetical protein n=1 Tax=Streptomyces platensis TaxID=58346 RepID=UPI00332B5A0E